MAPRGMGDRGVGGGALGIESGQWTLEVASDADLFPFSVDSRREPLSPWNPASGVRGTMGGPRSGWVFEVLDF